MKEKENIKKELEIFAPFLAKHREQPSPFKVPNGYFDTLESQIMEQVSLEDTITSSTKIRPLYFWLTSAAAILLLVFGLSLIHI